MSRHAPREERLPPVRARAPGRVNLVGEHTDYAGGYALPTPIPRYVTVEITARADRRVRVWHANAAANDAVEFGLGSESPAGDWADRVRGVTHRLRAQGCRFAGFDASITTDGETDGLPITAVLSVALQRALRERFGLPVSDAAIALNAQRVELEFVRRRLGIVDPFAASLGRIGEALFVDTRTLAIRRLPIPTDIELVVIDPGTVDRQAAHVEAQRRRECELAAARLGVRELGDVGAGDVGRVEGLGEVLTRRARHVVTENARVLAAVDALEAGNVERLGELMTRSHRSLRDDFQLSTPAVDVLVSALSARPGVLGAHGSARSHCGAAVGIAWSGSGREAAASACDIYKNETGHDPVTILPPHAS